MYTALKFDVFDSLSRSFFEGEVVLFLILLFSFFLIVFFVVVLLPYFCYF